MMNEQRKQALIQARLRQGWAQADLAEKMGVAPKTVARWESGRTIPQPGLRVKLGTLLQIDPEELWPLQTNLFVLPGSKHEIDVRGSLETQQPLALPAVWNIPYARNPFFIGQEGLLEQLHTRFHAGQALALSQSQALSGLGGIGKTQLAIEYAYRYSQNYEVVLWARAESTEALVSSYIAIAALLRLPESEAKAQEITVQAMKVWLQTHRNWLLILDNADDLSLLPNFLPLRLGGHLLMTTRAAATGQLAYRLEIDTLELAQGALFLLRRAALIGPLASLEQASQEDQELARQISQELGGLPLALDQAGAYLEETGTDLPGYWLIYQQHRADLLQKRGGPVADHPAPVATTWSLSFQRVQEQQPAAAELLRLLAFLSPETIPEEILTAGASLLGPILSPVADDPFLLNQAIEALRAYSLVRRDAKGKMLSIHRLVQAVLQDQFSEPEKRTWSARVVFAVNAVFPQVEPHIWLQCERLLSQAMTAARIIERYQLTSEEAGRLLHEIADYLLERARYGEAEPLCQRALHIREQQLGSQHPWVASSLDNLARLYRRQGKYVEAELLCQRALYIREQALGPQHSEVASSLDNLANIFLEQGKYAQAEPLYQQALHIREPQLGSQHPEVSSSLVNLARLYRRQGKYAEAEPFYQRALHIREQELGPQHPWVASSLDGLARLYLAQGKYAEAEPLCQRALRIREQELGPQHHWVASSLDCLANIFREQGKYAEAEPLYQRALRIHEQAWGSQHPETAETMHDLAQFREVQGNREEARIWYARALEVREQALGAQHPKTVQTRKRFIALLHAMGRHEEGTQIGEIKLNYQ